MRTLVRWAVLMALLSVAAWLGARGFLRSSWGRDHAERWIGRALEMEVAVGDVHLDWPASVVAEDLKAWHSADRSAPPDLTVREFRTGLFGAPVELRHLRLRLVQGPAGEWRPAALRGLARGLDPAVPLEAILDAVARCLPACRMLRVTDATVVGLFADGTEKPLFGGLAWSYRRVWLKEHARVTQHRATLQARAGQVADTENGLLAVEWLSARGRAPLRLWDARDALAPTTAPPPAAPAAAPAPAAPVPVTPVPATPAPVAPEDAAPVTGPPLIIDPAGAL